MLKQTLYPWLTPYWQKLTKLKKPSGFPHALILSGIKGVGKVQLAKTLTQWLICQLPQDFACGQCRSCHLFQENHPDIRYVGLEDDAISIDDVRELKDFCNLSNHFHGYKVIVLAADKLNHHAANALLKVLEEPPTNVVFILITTKYALLNPTITSRCLHMPMAIPTQEQSEAWLKQFKVPEQDIAQALVLARGAPLEAVEILSDLSSEQQKGRKIWLDMFKNQHQTEFFYEPIQEYITACLPQALYLVYQLVTQLIQERMGEKDTKKLFSFLDKLKIALETAQLNGINKHLLVESLFYDWQNTVGQMHGTTK